MEMNSVIISTDWFLPNMWYEGKHLDIEGRLKLFEIMMINIYNLQLTR